MLAGCMFASAVTTGTEHALKAARDPAPLSHQGGLVNGTLSGDECGILEPPSLGVVVQAALNAKNVTGTSFNI